MILDVLGRAKELDEHAKLQTQTATALMFFAGVRLAKLAGQRGRHDGQTLSVKQSVWRTHTTDPKTPNAARPFL